MDIKLFFTTFIVIFLAELGDKTQLATMGLSSSNSSKWTVFFGSSLALIASSGIGVLAGSLFENYINPEILTKISGFLFLILGIFILYNSYFQKS
jgi:Ca2+/H+ antiporter, TMEM165/GDT1 family